MSQQEAEKAWFFNTFAPNAKGKIDEIDEPRLVRKKQTISNFYCNCTYLCHALPNEIRKVDWLGQMRPSVLT